MRLYTFDKNSEDNSSISELMIQVFRFLHRCIDHQSIANEQHTAVLISRIKVLFTAKELSVGGGPASHTEIVVAQSDLKR